MRAPSKFQISLRHAIWRVTLDGVFFGDYRSQADATDSADAAAAALREQGRTVTVAAPVKP